ncbi:hypothetical protein GCWU000282_02996 [Catonella morbi ATCC 51271]|uniref:Uncharacterized protein n=1 Tax=Catonella morbi ATCC 51271 TaxID=592026 RepID=V2Y1D1_9FIRM|nr:hypothetical protein GCWU000282_02996 [Catonella morbi ATCC 51271]
MFTLNITGCFLMGLYYHLFYHLKNRLILCFVINIAYINNI